MQNNTEIKNVLIVSITPYFLERSVLWFKENLDKILEARKTQSFFEDNILLLEKNQPLNLSHFLRKLDEMGYEKVQTVESPGEFSQKGGIVDVLPINSIAAFRFDFLGNKLENIEKLEIEIEDEEKSKEILKKKLKSQKLFSDLKNLKPGDYLVHLDHGVARFSKIEEIQIPASRIKQYKPQIKKYYVLEYAAGDMLYVPLGLERKLSRYVGFQEPKISRLGSAAWQNIKKKIKEDAEKFAKELLEIYSKREIAARPAYPISDEFDALLESTFQYEETPDQLETIEEIKKDLEKPWPMDRLVCGDVGFGKTEIALRAIVKVVKSGHLSVLISPTTILANQHFQNFKKRLQNFPFKVALLTRLQSKKEQIKIIGELKENRIDILIGTHRILSDDIAPLLFNREAGLLIIDDEQKFGVLQKEKIKKLRSLIDVLSLSATPIPRTLHLALSAIKNISLIKTPPLGRLPIKTFVSPFSYKLIKKAISDEISKGGQIYYLHNRVENIKNAEKLIQKIFPNLKIGIAHGRMKERKLIKIMDALQNRNIDILIATTIIENGLDIPNVNTLIVDDASRLGLSQAYQIRGRIGRSHKQAFAYFFHGRKLTDKAKLRLKALKEAKELSSGYQIALKDLEIRGTGNILGKDQSGNVNRVGLNLYCQMVAESVEKLKQGN